MLGKLSFFDLTTSDGFLRLLMAAAFQVPFCMNIRQKLAEQKRSIARRADMMMRRRIDGLQAVAGGE